MNIKVGLALVVIASLPLLSVIATANQGWYLMEPPLKSLAPGVAGVDRTAPMHRWTHVRAFDSAKDCEVVLSERGSSAAKDLNDPSQRFRRAALESAIDGRCVSSSDPRLNP